MKEKVPLRITEQQISEALTFDDVLLQPGYSEILPNETNSFGAENQKILNQTNSIGPENQKILNETNRF